jgi:tetratricopeptide (TPR) repeat protein
MNPIKISLDTPPRVVIDTISHLREQKGKEKEVLALIREAIESGNSYIIQLFWEEFIVHQHIVMAERAKPQGGKESEKVRKALLGMEMAVKEADYYIKKYQLEQWGHRLHRFWGRLYDYKSLFKKAAAEYKKAIPLARLDPEVIEKRYPRDIEVRAFLSYSLIMSGETKKGMALAKEAYGQLRESGDGTYLKTKDYFTWAVWLSGIPIRTIGALIDRNIIFKRREMLSWLSEVERVLVIPKGERTWGDKNFQFRKDEIEALKKRLAQN